MTDNDKTKPQLLHILTTDFKPWLQTANQSLNPRDSIPLQNNQLSSPNLFSKITTSVTILYNSNKRNP